MNWTWISVLLCAAILAWLAFVARVRSSIQKYADDLRNVMRDMQLQTQQLTNVREAARETKKESQRRASELKQLRSAIESLTKQVQHAANEKQALTESLRASQELVTDLRRTLARSEARCKKLQADVTTASLSRWELLSRLHTDTTQRLAAFDHLRKPQNPPLLRDSSSPPSRQLSEHSLSPTIIAKSPSGSCLLSLRPDLTVSEDEEEQRDLEHFAIGPSQFERAQVNDFSASHLASASQRHDLPLSLLRTPWLDSTTRTADGTGESSGSLANALQPQLNASSSGLIARSALNDGGDQSNCLERI
eukprot:TRINITY_DN162_c0_g1_i10.p1 TRINITY_DN162_c0_g1~~TRINITY_DN162_c0_g1_i10.p1  ORF type:complete len:306 (+),score=56.22 TRINITY_DN162_c0_g1_i10:2044-2961(+)